MPKKIDEITEEELLSDTYYVCEICKRLCIRQETATCDFKTKCKCKDCYAVEREKVIKKEEDEIEKFKKERIQEIKKYLIDNPVVTPPNN